MSVRHAWVRVVASSALLLTSCTDDAPSSADPPSSTSGSAASCVSAATAGSSLSLEVPAGFRADPDGVMANQLDQVWTRDDPESNAPQIVTLHAFDPDAYGQRQPDSFVLLRAVTATSSSDSGRPEFEEAVRTVRTRQPTDIQYSAKNPTDDDRHTLHAELVRVGEDRFTVTLLADEGETFEELRDAVLPTIEEGDCPG
jgi:hypothetical protein